MKNQMIKYIAGVVAALTFTIPLMAEAGDPNDPDAGTDPGAPVDSWAILLFAAGLVMGLIYLKKYRKIMGH